MDTVRAITSDLLRTYGSFIQAEVDTGYYDPYLITFMFQQMLGNPQALREQMSREVERVYGTMLTRCVRNPRSPRHAGLLPRWIACCDYPIAKNAKVSLREVTINDGAHMHAIALLPTKSRFKSSLDWHFRENQRLYIRAGLPLMSVSAKVVSHDDVGYVVGYAFKAISKGQATLDDLIILPRAKSEL